MTSSTAFGGELTLGAHLGVFKRSLQSSQRCDLSTATWTVLERGGPMTLSSIIGFLFKRTWIMSLGSHPTSNVPATKVPSGQTFPVITFQNELKLNCSILFEMGSAVADKNKPACRA